MPNRHYWSSSNQNEMYVHLLPNVNHTQIKESVSLSHSHSLLRIVMLTVKYIYFHLIHALSTSMCSVQFSLVRFSSVRRLLFLSLLLLLFFILLLLLYALSHFALCLAFARATIAITSGHRLPFIEKLKRERRFCLFFLTLSISIPLHLSHFLFPSLCLCLCFPFFLFVFILYPSLCVYVKFNLTPQYMVYIYHTHSSLTACFSRSLEFITHLHINTCAFIALLSTFYKPGWKQIVNLYFESTDNCLFSFSSSSSFNLSHIDMRWYWSVKFFTFERAGRFKRFSLNGCNKLDRTQWTNTWNALYECIIFIFSQVLPVQATWSFKKAPLKNVYHSISEHGLNKRILGMYGTIFTLAGILNLFVASSNAIQIIHLKTY